MWPFNLSVRLLIVDLVGRYPTNYLIRRKAICQRIAPFPLLPCGNYGICGISSDFSLLFPSDRQVTYALLTSPPLTASKVNFRLSSFDLHVLCAPPAFILSQDQTLLFLVSISSLSKCINLFRVFWLIFNIFFFGSIVLPLLVFSKVYCLLFNVLFCRFC